MKKFRFEITSKGEKGRPTVRRTNDLVEAWDWFAYFTGINPAGEVEIIDHEQDVEARG